MVAASLANTVTTLSVLTIDTEGSERILSETDKHGGSTAHR